MTTAQFTITCHGGEGESPTQTVYSRAKRIKSNVSKQSTIVTSSHLRRACADGEAIDIFLCFSNERSHFLYPLGRVMRSCVGSSREGLSPRLYSYDIASLYSGRWLRTSVLHNTDLLAVVVQLPSLPGLVDQEIFYLIEVQASKTFLFNKVNFKFAFIAFLSHLSPTSVL